jgi:hypothetical protein
MPGHPETSHCRTSDISLPRLRRTTQPTTVVEGAFPGLPSNKFPKLYVHLWRTYFFGQLSPSNSNGCFLTLGAASHPPGPCAIREEVMFLHSTRSEQLATLAGQVSLAEEATPELLSEIVAKTARRLSAPGAAQLDQLIEAGALIEAALALVNLELPLWQIRRITYDEGEWHCAMSRQRELPEWLDRAIETSHASLTLAIVSVYIEALRQIEASREPSRPSVPQTRGGQFEPVCCDNFA